MSTERSMSRRGFLRASVGAAGVAGASGAATAAESGGSGGSGGSVEVAVGPGGNFVFEPGTDSPLTIPPGTTVNFVWKSNTHNIVVESQPEKANWQGHETIENEGFEYSHTFTVTGKYHYYCRPHRSAGMVADIVVEEGATLPGEGKAADPSIPDSAKAIGVATTVAMFATLGLAFTLLKYGGGSREE